MPTTGYLALILHAHLPFVRHPEHDDFLEEDWLYEAITETYIPLLEMFEALERDQADWRLTMSITPTLAAMLADPLLQYRYVRHLDNLIALANKELERTRWQPEFYRLAEMYLTRFSRCREVFVEQYDHNLLTGFRRFFQTGKLELISCVATHGFMPLMDNNTNAMRVQVEVGCQEFERHFGRRPTGMWLAECGYTPGVDELLRDAGIRYFFTDTHGILFAHPRPTFGVYAPIVCPASGVLALGRDTESSVQVWSATQGYPGDPNYREFYRDIGHELDYDYLKPHLHQIGVRTSLGIKYFRIGSPRELPKPYDPEAARAKAIEHAGNFVFNRERQAEWLIGAMDRPPLIVAPYDAELFGHWWYEGPLWLEALLRKLYFEVDTIKPITIPEYISRHPHNQPAQPIMSSWGSRGYCEVWLEPANDWIYPHLHEHANRMVELAREYAHGNIPELTRRALNQAARELLLAQASDWAFIMRAGTVVDYAVQRTSIHVSNFNELYEQIKNHRIDEPWLCEIERRHNIFPTIDFRLYC
jgi:1,4-alpha-glucan branching enzyme